MTQQQKHSCSNSGGIDESSSRFNMASLKINLPQNHKRRSRGGLSRYYSGKARSFKCLNEVHSIEDLKKHQQDYNINNIVPPVDVDVDVDAHHHSNNNNNNKKKRNTSSSFCSISSMSKEDIKQHTLFYA